jgi:hypothetical protein
VPGKFDLISHLSNFESYCHNSEEAKKFRLFMPDAVYPLSPITKEKLPNLSPPGKSFNFPHGFINLNVI